MAAPPAAARAASRSSSRPGAGRPRCRARRPRGGTCGAGAGRIRRPPGTSTAVAPAGAVSRKSHEGRRPRGVARQQEPAAADVAGARMGDRERKRGGHRRVDRVAAAPQHLHADLRGEKVLRAHHPVPRAHRRHVRGAAPARASVATAERSGGGELADPPPSGPVRIGPWISKRNGAARRLSNASRGGGRLAAEVPVIVLGVALSLAAAAACPRCAWTTSTAATRPRSASRSTASSSKGHGPDARTARSTTPASAATGSR